MPDGDGQARDAELLGSVLNELRQRDVGGHDSLPANRLLGLALSSSRTIPCDLNIVQEFLALSSSQGSEPYGGDMPRDTLTLEQIVTAAVELLDAEGLEGLNMRALGSRLDSAATAVYWHVGSKE